MPRLISAADPESGSDVQAAVCDSPTRSVSMSEAAALPSDVWGRIACAALTADGSTLWARGRLSLVCRTWRDGLRSAPLHLVLWKLPAAQQLRQASSNNVFLGSVELRDRFEELPPESASAVVVALTHSASTLTALHGFPLIELPDSSPGIGLAALTRLRALTLHQHSESPRVLRASQLPASVEELTLMLGVTLDDYLDDAVTFPPDLVGFHELHNLRRITLAGYHNWRLGFTDSDEGQHGRPQLPPRLETIRVETGQDIELEHVFVGGLGDSNAVHDEQTLSDQRPACRSLSGPGPLMLEVCGDVSFAMEYTPQYSPGDDAMLTWAGRGTELPPGFAVMRLVRNTLHCSVQEELPDAGPGGSARARTQDPAHLLCRALRLAPTCYRRFVLAPEQSSGPLVVYSSVQLLIGIGGNELKFAGSTGRRAEFSGIPELAAAMRRFAAAEGVNVRLTPDERSIIMSRAGGDSVGGIAADVS